MPTPEDLARQYVSVVAPDGGSWCVRVAVPGVPAVDLGPHPNPAVAKGEADALRVVLAATLRLGKDAAPGE